MTMHWAPDLSEPIILVTFVIGAIMLMRKLADMDRYLELRVLILTALFSWFVLYFFLTFGSPFIDPVYSPCLPEHFCMTEM